MNILIVLIIAPLLTHCGYNSLLGFDLNSGDCELGYLIHPDRYDADLEVLADELPLFNVYQN